MSTILEILKTSEPAILDPISTQSMKDVRICAVRPSPTQSKVSKGNLVPRVFSLSNMAAAGEKTLAHSRNHVTDLSTESGNLFKMAAKIKSERIWVRGLETGEKLAWVSGVSGEKGKNGSEKISSKKSPLP